jgi:hypothetical protein
LQWVGLDLPIIDVSSPAKWTEEPEYGFTLIFFAPNEMNKMTNEMVQDDEVNEWSRADLECV